MWINRMKSYQKTLLDLIAKNPKVLLLRPRCNGKNMSRHYFLNPDHSYTPCDVIAWAKQFGLNDTHVADDMINDHHVSTVWLGLDYNYWGGPPLVFETMVFKPDGGDNYCVRYTTWEQAEAGHQEAISWVKNGCKRINDERN